jgi:Flp pilus assembly protein TadG
MRNHIRTRTADERGVSTLELLLLTPLLLVVLLGVVQVALVAQARQAAQDAALAAARADRLDRDPGTAANQAVTDRLRPVSATRTGASDHSWSVRIHVPSVFPGADIDVRREAVLP